MILRIHASLPLVVAAAFLAACPVVSPGATDAGSDETAADGSTTGSPMTGGTTGAETSTVMLSFATDIQPILDGACVPSCHTATPAAGSGLPWGDYSGGLGYMKWLGADGMGAASLESQALKLVEPGDREASYVWHKVNNTHLGPPANGSLDPMPPPTSMLTLAPADKESIGQWIDGGANP